MLVRSRLLFALKPYHSLKPSPAVHPGLHRLTTMPPPTLTPHTLALPETDDDPTIRQKYRPFLTTPQQAEEQSDWTNSLELTTVLSMVQHDLHKPSSQGRLKVLVLYGSLRSRSYSKLVAFEAARILFRLGCDVRVFDPEGLPVKNEVDAGHAKVLELRGLSQWSDGHVWVSPEQHGNLVSALPLLLPSCLILSKGER